MFLPSKVYYDLREACARAEGAREALKHQVATLDVTCDWFRVRISQLEHERALMIQHYTGVTVPALSIEKAPVPNPTQLRQSYDPVAHFADVGDTEAARMGISWHPETGEVVYAEK